MQLQFNGVEGSGIGMLDSGIGGFTVIQSEQGTFVYSTTGKNGGIVGYRIDDSGEISVHTTVTFPDNMTWGVDDRLVVVDNGNGPMLAVGTNDRGIMGFSVLADGTIGRRERIDWDDAAEAASTVGNGILEAWVTMSNRSLDIFPGDSPGHQAVSLRSAIVDGREFVLVACKVENTLSSYLRDPSSGHLIAFDSLGASDGVGINAPTAMEVVQMGGESFVILASAGTSSLTVMRLGADGSLNPTDHLLDTGATRFASVQAMTAVTVGDHAFVIAGGGDHGLTLFALLPDGTLLALDTVADNALTALHNVSSLSAVVVGDTLHVFAGSQRDAGMNHFTLSLDQLGQRLYGTAGQASVITGTARNDILIAMADGDTLIGGGGNDILVAGPGTTTMRGGDGADIFVMRAGSGPTHILDFEAGTDRVDLSDWPMLRYAGQLTFTTTANGARIEYRDMVVHITSSDGRPLSIEDVLGDGFHWPDRIPILIERDAPGELILGRHGENDTITGTYGDDTIRGLKGDDLIFVIGGDNVVWGGHGNNTIHGGNGNDVIRGQRGDDLIYGGGGNNFLAGGAGSDTIFGGGGPDLIYGGGGNNLLRGDRGNDTIIGGDGNDTIIAGPGRDWLWGGEGANTFIFQRNHDTNRIMDFNPANGDILLLSSGVFGGRFRDDPIADNIHRFSFINDNGDLVLDFGGANTQIILVGFSDIDLLIDHIQIM